MAQRRDKLERDIIKKNEKVERERLDLIRKKERLEKGRITPQELFKTSEFSQWDERV